MSANMTMVDDVATLVPKSMQTLLKETLFHAADQEAYIINRGEPGFVDTMKSLTAKIASTPPGPGRKPIVSHANHVLYGLDLVARAIGGDMHAFDSANWDAAWKLEQVDEAAWKSLLGRLEATAQHVVDFGPKMQQWNEIMFTGMLGVAAHAAYHLGAVRQILRDVGEARS